MGLGVSAAEESGVSAAEESRGLISQQQKNLAIWGSQQQKNIGLVVSAAEESGVSAAAKGSQQHAGLRVLTYIYCYAPTHYYVPRALVGYSSIMYLGINLFNLVSQHASFIT